MADVEKNTDQEEQITLDVPGASPPPDLKDEGPPVPEPGDVVVDTGKIDELIAKRNAAARVAVEHAEDAPTLTGEGDKATEAPASDKEGEDHREPWEKTQAELDEKKKKPRRGRPPKAKTVQEAAKPKRRGRPPKTEKSSSEQAKENGFCGALLYPGEKSAAYRCFH